LTETSPAFFPRAATPDNPQVARSEPQKVEELKKESIVFESHSYRRFSPGSARLESRQYMIHFRAIPQAGKNNTEAASSRRNFTA
jgi:hypothetical protein